MYFGKLVDRLGNRIKDFDISDSKTRTIAKEFINDSAKWIYRAHFWEWRQKMFQLTLLPNVTSGTCSVTKYNGSNGFASRTVTFSGVTLTENLKGRFFNVTNSNGSESSDWHKINYVNVAAGTVVLETPVIDDSGSGLSYKIAKRFYNLPSEVDYITDIGRLNSNYGRLEYSSFSNLVDRSSDVNSGGSPEQFVPFGVDNFEPSYSAGTISVDKDSNVVVGTDTVWMDNVLPGDKISVGDAVFTVKRVETDTRLALYNYATESIPTGSNYTINRNLSVGVQFYPASMASYITIPVYYMDKMFDMVHEDKDAPNLPDEFDEVILSRAEFKIKKDKSDPNWTSIANLFAAELDAIKKNYRTSRPRYDIFAPTVHGYSGRGDSYGYAKRYS